jgi:hypothetical protein
VLALNPWPAGGLQHHVSESTKSAGTTREAEPTRSLWDRFSRSHYRTLAVALAGAGVGAAYAHFVGCSTGTCPITSNAWTAALYGGGVGALAAWPSRAR